MSIMSNQICVGRNVRKRQVIVRKRQVILSIAGAALSFGVLTALFPNTFWFVRLWCGAIAGTWCGLRLAREFARSKDKGRKTATTKESAFFVLTFLMVLPVFVPDLFLQERMRAKLRRLRAEEIRTVFVVNRDVPENRRAIPDSQIEDFISRFRDADLVYPSHEGLLGKFEIDIHMKDNTELHFDTTIPERHSDDVDLRFRAFLTTAQVRVPGGRKWIKGD